MLLFAGASSQVMLSQALRTAGVWIYCIRCLCTMCDGMCPQTLRQGLPRWTQA